MIKKTTFVSIINAIQAQDKLDSKNGEILTQLADPEFQNHGIIYTTPIIQELLKILKDECDLPDQKYIGDDISYYIYDLNYGTNDMANSCITRADGSKVSLTSPESLYDWIVEQQQEKTMFIDDTIKERGQPDWDNVVEPIISKRGSFKQ